MGEPGFGGRGLGGANGGPGKGGEGGAGGVCPRLAAPPGGPFCAGVGAGLLAGEEEEGGVGPRAPLAQEEGGMQTDLRGPGRGGGERGRAKGRRRGGGAKKKEEGNFIAFFFFNCK